MQSKRMVWILSLVFLISLVFVQGAMANQPTQINIISPDYEPLDNRRVALEIEVDEKCDLAYADFHFDISDISEFTPEQFEEDVDFSEERYFPLCRDCDRYRGFKTFRDGSHTVNVMCLDKPEVNSTVGFIVDNKPPRVSSTYPKRNSFTNGSDFRVRYTEENLLAVVFDSTTNSTFKIGPSLPGLFLGLFYEAFSGEVPGDCPKGRNVECMFDVDLSEHDGQEIEYSFAVIDIAGNFDESRVTKVTVDTTPPQVMDFDYSFDRRRVALSLEIDELNFDRITYIDLEGRNQRERTLCSRLTDGKCERKSSFGIGGHDLRIFVKDKAGNYAETISLQFSCDRSGCFE